MKETQNFIWEEKNSTEPKMNYENKNEYEMPDIIPNIVTKFVKEISEDTIKKWVRNCSKCNNIIYYKSLSSRNRSIKKNKDVIRQNNIIQYFENIQNPLKKFIRVITWENNKEKIVYED